MEHADSTSQGTVSSNSSSSTGQYFSRILLLSLGVLVTLSAFIIYSVASNAGNNPLRGLTPLEVAQISAENSKLPDRFTNITFGGPLCDSLMSADISTDFGVSPHYERMHEYSKHTMQFPPPRSDYYVDVPAKSGNHNWKGLFYRLWIGVAPDDFEAEAKEVLAVLEMLPNQRYLKPQQQVWLLVRNPYVRLLSVYLKKGLRCKLRGYFMSDPPSQMLRNYGALTFEQYVIALTNHMIFDDNRGSPMLSRQFVDLWRDSGGNFTGELKQQLSKNAIATLAAVTAPMSAVRGDADVRYAMPLLPRRLLDPNPCVNRSLPLLLQLIDPSGRVQALDLPDREIVHSLERANRLCLFNHHFCVQSAGLFKQQPGRVKVLRLEEQSRWYAQFLRCFGIRNEEVVGPDWHDFEGKDCFYTPTGDCADAVTAMNHSTGLAAGGVHPTSAADLMNEYYTPLAAELAYYLYQYDFERLGYKKWDGVSDFAKFSS